MMPSPRALIARALRPVLRALEGSVRAGPHYLPLTGGWLPAGAPLNWWQTGLTPVSGERSAIVEACVSAYAQTIAMLPGDHWRSNRRGGRTRVTTSALSRILRHPNNYQTISDLLLNLVRSLYFTGNAYALALRNNKFEIDELHLMDPNQSSPQVIRGDHEFSGEIFYQLGGNDVIGQRLATNERWRGIPLMVPMRDVLHIRLHSTKSNPKPLVGETPLTAAFADMAMVEQFKDQQQQFLANRAAPSAVLSTDLNLDATQVQSLRDRWNEQSKGLHAGGVPILTHGLKVMPWTTPAPARDLQLAELLQLTDNHIALVFRIPLQILGLGSAPFSSTQTLMNFWLASGLGFCLNHVEQSFDKLFGLAGQPDEYVEFDTSALLRSDQKGRIDALTKGVLGGLYSPNEARNIEGLDSVAYGDEPRVQQQVVPLSAAATIPVPMPQAAPPAASVTAAETTKSYQAAVSRDIEAMKARAKKPKPVIRKVVGLPQCR